MTPSPRPTDTYHVFLASPGDVAAERRYVRRFFDEYNRHTAHIWNARFEVVDWENYATIGVGRPQDLITQHTLENYRGSLVLVIGIMAQRLGAPSGKAESGTVEEFDRAMESYKATGFPEIKWFFRKVDKLEIPADSEDEAEKTLDQWKKVRAFRERMQDPNDPVFYTEYPDEAGFAEVFGRDLNRWLADPARPWAAEREARLAAAGAAAMTALPAQFDAERYQAAVLKRFDTLDFEMLDTTGAFYSGVRLWSVFVPQSAREYHQYHPRLLEIPKEHQQRLLDAGEITAGQLDEAQAQAERLRQDYFSQPRRPVVEVIDGALRAGSSSGGRKLVILGDPGSGKSSLIRYLALRWARIAEPAVRDTQPVPLVIDLGNYGRWQCEGRKGFIRFLEEAPVWHQWPRGLLDQLAGQPGRLVLLLDGLDEIFDLATREAVINDIQRFSNQFPHTPVLVTSRVVGYQPQRLRDADFRHFMLQDLDAEQITAFVDRWHEETFDAAEQAAPKRDRLQKAIRDSRSIAMLAGNPLLLTMMAILNRNQELPRDRADLYAQASRVLLHQWDTERTLVGFPDISAEVGLREKTDILRRVAAHMQSTPSSLTGNMIDGLALTALVENYLCSELRFEQARAAARALVEQLRQRNFILCFVGADSYAFVHRTFLEYFCAADIVHRFNVAKTLSEQDLIDLFDAHCRDDDWREVLRLICGQIDEQFVGQIVEHLATRTDPEQWNGRTSLPELPLAVYCLSELRSLSRVEDAGSRLLQQTIRVATKAELAAHQFLMSEFLPACRELGTRWPGKDQLEGLALSQPDHFPELGPGPYFWPYLIAQVTANREAVRELAHTARGTGSGLTRGAALKALADKWPDETTRELLEQRATQDEDGSPRGAALEALAEHWPIDATRQLLEQRAIQDKDSTPRYAALLALAGQWPDQTTHELLTQRAVQDKDRFPRSTALWMLAAKWPDETTRQLLEQRAVQDEHYYPRRTALAALAEHWPDQTTRDLLEQRAVQDKDNESRRTALEVLADKWPDQTTRELLEQRAIQDKDGGPRSAALRALVEKWSDQTTRELLDQRAVQDEDEYPRSAALQALAEQWPDRTTRELLEQRATQDEDEGPRRFALEALAEQWPDQTTRELLEQRSVQDEHWFPRHAALWALAEQWPDENTRNLLESVLADDHDREVRELALKKLLQGWPDAHTRSVCRSVLEEDADPAIRSVTAKELASSMWEDAEVRKSVREVAHADESLRSHLGTLQERLVGGWENYLQGTTERSALPNMPNGFPAIRIEAFRLRNIRCFVDTGEVGLSTPVTMLLGNNAAGKSTILQCLALASVGSRAANEVELNAPSYLRSGARKGIIEVRFSLIPEPDAFTNEYGHFCVGLAIQDNTDRFIPLPNSEMELGPINCIQKLEELRSESDLAFALICGYGATRTFSDSPFGVEKEFTRDENEWVSSLFHHDAGLVNPDVLSKLFRGDTRNIKDAPDSLAPEIAESLRASTRGLLPRVDALYSDGRHDLRLHDTDLDISDVSDGYRGLLAIVGHLVRSSLKLSAWESDPTKVHGVVLIDEVDLHLHPAWQRTVIDDLKHAFPNIQFILSTHSALVARAMNPPDIRVIEQSGSEASIHEYSEPVHGVSVDNVLLGSYFNLYTTQGTPVEAERRRLAEKATSGDREASLEFIRTVVTRETEGSGTG